MRQLSPKQKPSTLVIARRKPRGFSLVELLVVMAIMSLLAVGMVAVGSHVRTNAKIRDTESTIRILCTALDAYQEYHDTGSSNFKFPTPPVDHTKDELNDELSAYFGGTNVEMTAANEGDHEDYIWDDEDDLADTTDQDIDAQKERRQEAIATIEFLYFHLNDTPPARDIIKNLPNSVVANDDEDYLVDKRTTSDRTVPFLEVNDAWGHPLWYRRPANGFPKLISAGPDGVFRTADDIVSTEL